MIFDVFKEDVVEQKGWATEKEIKKFILRLALLVIILTFGIGILLMTTVGMLVTIAFIVVMTLVYIGLVDIADEEEHYFKTLMKVSKFWWLAIPIDVAIIVILNMFMFL